LYASAGYNPRSEMAPFEGPGDAGADGCLRPRAASLHRHGDLPSRRIRGAALEDRGADRDAVAVVQGTTERPGEQPFRQNNQFFYMVGAAEPRAIAVIK
jgi:hypothetical protein